MLLPRIRWRRPNLVHPRPSRATRRLSFSAPQLIEALHKNQAPAVPPGVAGDAVFAAIKSLIPAMVNKPQTREFLTAMLPRFGAQQNLFVLKTLRPRLDRLAIHRSTTLLVERLVRTFAEAGGDSAEESGHKAEAGEILREHFLHIMGEERIFYADFVIKSFLKTFPAQTWRFVNALPVPTLLAAICDKHKGKIIATAFQTAPSGDGFAHYDSLLALFDASSAAPFDASGFPTVFVEQAFAHWPPAFQRQVATAICARVCALVADKNASFAVSHILTADSAAPGVREDLAAAVLAGVGEIARREGGDGKFIVVRRAMAVLAAADELPRDGPGAAEPKAARMREVREQLRGLVAELADEPYFHLVLAEVLAGLSGSGARDVVAEVMQGGRSFTQFSQTFRNVFAKNDNPKVREAFNEMTGDGAAEENTKFF